MIHSARPTVPPETIAILTLNLFYLRDFEKCGRTDTTCENSDNNYRPWLWVGRVDQNI